MNPKYNKSYIIKPTPFDPISMRDGLLPLPIRCLIIGTSGCGKTTLLYNLITEPWGIPFENFYVFSKSLEQKVYKGLRKAYEKLTDKIGKEIAHFYSSCDELIGLDECQPNSLIVFDDCVNEQQQQIIKDYYVRGRHKNISCIYLTQSYTKVDKQLIRNNVNFLCIFKQSNAYIKTIYDEYVGSDFTFERFKEICGECWKDTFGFLTIDATLKKESGRYGKNFQLEITK